VTGHCAHYDSPGVIVSNHPAAVDEETKFDRADRSCAPAGGGCQNSIQPPYSTFDEAGFLKRGFIKGFLHCNLEPPWQFSSCGERLALKEGGEEHRLERVPSETMRRWPHRQ
jgi:hypothetical protein